jgi:hypothetical protein
METPIIDGNKKNTKVVKPLNNPITPIGEFTIFEDPVVTVRESKIPAEAAAKSRANKKKITIYI